MKAGSCFLVFYNIQSVRDSGQEAVFVQING